MKVLVSDNLSDVGVQILRDSEGLEVDVKVGLSPDELIGIIPDYHGLAIRGATKVTAEVIAAADNLKVVGRAGTGLDNVDIPAASKRGIVVMNTPGGNSVTTAEHSLSMMMALARNIPQAHSSMKNGKWEKKKFGGTEILNKTLGVVGLGQIGKIVADRAMGLGMNVIGYDPFLSEDHAKQLGIQLVSLDQIFREADFITLHVPLTDETRTLINKDTISKMKDGVRIVNCSRGMVVNEDDLADAVESGKVAGAALDVYPVEPPPEDSRLVSLDRIICTPHLGASTKEAQENVAVAVATQIKDYLLTATVRNAVNAPAVSGEALVRLKPYLDLAYKLGLYTGQLIEGGMTGVEAQYSGAVTEMDTSPITTSFLTGLLRPILKDDVNQVNAPMVAEERGIVISETKVSKQRDFVSLLGFKVTTEQLDLVVEGTLFGAEPRMVRHNLAHGEFDLSGEILLLRAFDKPGLIGKVGTALGNRNINISHFQFAREEEGGEALLFLNTDSTPDEETLEDLRAIEYVSAVRRLTM